MHNIITADFTVVSYMHSCKFLWLIVKIGLQGGKRDYVAISYVILVGSDNYMDCSLQTSGCTLISVGVLIHK
jgi:hypothetical protein